MCYVNVKLCHSEKGMNIDSGCFRTGCWGEHMDLRGRNGKLKKPTRKATLNYIH